MKVDGVEVTATEYNNFITTIFLQNNREYTG